MKVIAHRGASGEFPENSRLAFEQAIKQKADGIELDAQYHKKSGKFVLLHDPYITDEHGKELHYDDIPLVHLLAMKVDCQPVITLDDALTLINGRCLVNIELKSATTNRAEIKKVTSSLQALLNSFIKKHYFSNSQFVISSFNHPLLKQLKDQLPQYSISVLIACCPIELAKPAADLNALSINPSIDCLDDDIVKDAHQRGLEVWVYTVDRERDIIACLQLGVDAIFTNYPNRTNLIVDTLLKM